MIISLIICHDVDDILKLEFCREFDVYNKLSMPKKCFFQFNAFFLLRIHSPPAALAAKLVHQFHITIMIGGSSNYV
jgi:hypothetical protein